MTYIELSGENAMEVIHLLWGISAMAAVGQMTGKEGKTNEPMQGMQKEGDMPAGGKKPVQAGKGLGQTSEEEKKAVAAVEKLIDDLRENAKWIDDMPIPPEVQKNILKAARVLEIGLQRREYHKLGDAFKDLDILRVMEAFI